MKEFSISMPFTGVAIRTIEAQNEEEALRIFNETTTLNISGPESETDAEVMEWNFTEQIVQGNVFYGIQNEYSIQEQ